MFDTQIYVRKVDRYAKNSLFGAWNPTKVIWAQILQIKVQILQVFYLWGRIYLMNLVFFLIDDFSKSKHFFFVLVM